MSETARDAEAIRAAGGLLWCHRGGRRELALIHRHRYDDWTLPKGKVDRGESWRDAAVREVREETGYRADLGAFAGAVAYEVDGRPKVVRYWHMTVLGPERAAIDAGEVAEVVWLPVADALARLTHPLERALVETFLADERP